MNEKPIHATAKPEPIKKIVRPPFDPRGWMDLILGVYKDMKFKSRAKVRRQRARKNRNRPVNVCIPSGYRYNDPRQGFSARQACRMSGAMRAARGAE